MLGINQILQERYRIIEILGHGGMGAAYKAVDLRVQVECVVKELLIPVVDGGTSSANLVKQFQIEARTLANLRHPNLPRVSDYFWETSPDGKTGSYYLVMDFIEGTSLHNIIGVSGISETTVMHYARQLLDVLTYIHSKGVLHRDIKPANIIIQPDGRAVLVDFGLVKILEVGGGFTTRGFLHGAGTPEYAPPEQYTGGTDHRSDIYALGATLYHALTGQAPATVTDQMAGIKPLPPLRQLNNLVSDNTEKVISRAMSLNRNARYPSAAMMLVEMQTNNATSPIQRVFTASPENSATLSTVHISQPMYQENTARMGNRLLPLPRWIIALLVGAVVILTLVIMAVFTQRRGDTAANLPIDKPAPRVQQMPVIPDQNLTPVSADEIESTRSAILQLTRIAMLAKTKEALDQQQTDIEARQKQQTTQQEAAMTATAQELSRLDAERQAVVRANDMTATAMAYNIMSANATALAKRNMFLSATATAQAVHARETSIALTAIAREPTPCPSALGLNENQMKRMGCARSYSGNRTVVMQYFNGGMMIIFAGTGNEWRIGGDVLVLTNSGFAWRVTERFVQTSTNQDTWYSCNGVAGQRPEQSGIPWRGFGKVWCENSNIRQSLGNATSGEMVGNGVFELYENGRGVTAGGRTYAIFVLAQGGDYTEGRWE
jgi:eukaryotic-like serine/threonine-protein kinase